jgi:ABC-type nitrate/sulfonate/bicarbonate transport system substrate-binding protein
MNKVAWLSVVGVLFFLCASPSQAASDLKTVKITTPRGSVFILSYFAARDAGIFSKHGIDLQVDPRPFAGFMASLPSRETLVGTPAGLPAIEQMNQGRDLVVIGGGLTVMQNVFVRKDSPFRKITDLRGKRFGVYSTGGAATKALIALVVDGSGMDLRKETEFLEIAPPALMALLEKGEVAAMFNLSSLTISAATQPEKFRMIFSPDAYWKEKTGSTLVWSGPTVAWRDWIEENRERAKNFVAAEHESWEWLRQNSDEAVAKYGKLASINTPAEAEALKKMLKEGGVFLSKWDSQIIDAQWKFLELAKKVGILDKVPPKEKHAMVLR